MELPNVTYCCDLGITITSDLSYTQYITEIVSKAHRRANCILRSFTSGDTRLLLRAYIVYVRPLVEYNSIIWSPLTSYKAGHRNRRKSTATIHKAASWTEKCVIP